MSTHPSGFSTGLAAGWTKRTAPSDAISAGRLPGLDVVRIIAALLVTSLHYGFMFRYFSVPPSSADFGRVNPVFVSGWVGVQVFFVLSGFVIAYSAEHATALTFLRHRIARLWPAMLLCATLTSVLQRASHDVTSLTKTATGWIDSVTFVPGAFYADGSHWTLPVEVQFYIAIFLILFFGRSKELVRFMSIAGLVSVAYCWFTFIGYHAGNNALREVASSTRLSLGTWVDLLRYTIYFSLGTVLFQGLTRRFTRGLLVTAGILVASALADLEVRGHELTSPFGVSPSFATSASLWILSMAGMVLAVIFNARFKAFLGHRGNRILRRIGLMTYPVYLTHHSVGRFVVTHLDTGVGRAWAVCVACAVTYAVAYVITVWFEPPMARWLRSGTSAQGEGSQPGTHDRSPSAIVA